MSDAAQELIHRHRLTVDDYHLMAEAGILHEDSQVELINGEVLDMPPIGSEHAALPEVVFDLSGLSEYHGRHG